MDTLIYAKKELNKYWQLVTGLNYCEIELVVDKNKASRYYKQDYAEKFDDAYEIDVIKGIGKILGINKRSVLLGIYHFFQALGCKFLKPTASGEVIVNKDKRLCTVQLEFVPSNRHRGICIEGSVSIENCLNMIEWAPKVGFNAYFIQFRQGHEFFERWYMHQRNDVISKDKEKFTLEESYAYTKKMIQEIKKRDLIYHAVGHGWTCECLGIDSLGWQKANHDILTDDKKQLLALVNGKREFYEGIPLNTNLCYSNPKTKELLVNEIVTYIKNHSEIDILHFWLADNFNNWCECDECQKKNPTDHYVEILNQIDAQLTALNIDTKIVFLIYYELLYTAINAKIKNSDRFIMMFAPISRTYTKSYLTNGNLPDRLDCQIPDFQLNKIKLSTKIEDNLAFLFKWQEVFNGDSFLFDYHLMWDPFKDFPQLRLSNVIYDDIHSLKQLKLNGLVSCQLQRVFFPTALAMYVMGKSLSDSSLAYSEIVDEFFTYSYGKHAAFIKQILICASELLHYEYLRGELPVVSKELVPKYEKLEKKMKDYDELLSQIDSENEQIKVIQYFTKFLSMLAPVLAKKASGASVNTLEAMFKPVREYMLKHEMDSQTVFDGYFFDLIVGDFIKATW